MLFIRNSSHKSTILIVTHHKHRILQELKEVKYISLIRLLSLFEYMLEDSGSAENKEILLLFSHDKLSLASILRPLHQVTK